jgi:hypothetical protein
MASRYPHPILDADGRRVGVMTVDGPIVPDPALAADLSAARDREDAAMMEEAKRVSARRRAERFAELRALEDVVPGLIVPYSRLTMEERFIVEKALNAGRRVRRAPATKYGHEAPPIPPSDVLLPTVISYIRKTREYRDRSEDAARKAVTRAAHRLYNRGLATLEKDGAGLINIHVDRERIRHLVRLELEQKLGEAPDDIYLMRGTCKTQTFDAGPKRKSKKKTDAAALPAKASGERLEACRMLTGTKMLNKDDRADLIWRFQAYLDSTTQKILAFLDYNSGESFGCEYSTRFNDIAKAARSLNKIDYMLDKSFEKYWRAVFLTLTTDPNLTNEEARARREAEIADVEAKLSDPTLGRAARAEKIRKYWQLMGPDAEIEELERRVTAATATAKDLQRLDALRADLEESRKMLERLADPRTGIRTRENLIHGLKRMNRWRDDYDPDGFQNIWEANRSFSKNWNNFLAYVRKRLNASPEHIPAFEFTESGLLHAHAIIFVPYLMDVNDIVKEWRRLGQGQVVDVYTLRAVPKRDGSGKWEWRWNARHRPKTKGMSGGDYLKKYIKKAALALTDRHTSPAAIQAPYWAFNKRYFTGSPSLAEGFDAEARKPAAAGTAWGIWKVMSPDEASDWGLEIRYHRIVPAAQREREQRLLGAIG